MSVAKALIEGSEQVSLRETKNGDMQLCIIYPNDFELVICAVEYTDDEYDFEIIDLWAQYEDDNYKSVKGTAYRAEHLIDWSNYCRKL